MALDKHSFIEAAWPADAESQPGVRRWRAASRVVLATLFAFAALQYYFLDVQIRILTMPGVIVFASQPSGARKPCSPGTARQSGALGTPIPCG